MLSGNDRLSGTDRQALFISTTPAIASRNPPNCTADGGLLSTKEARASTEVAIRDEGQGEAADKLLLVQARPVRSRSAVSSCPACDHEIPIATR